MSAQTAKREAVRQMDAAQRRTTLVADLDAARAGARSEERPAAAHPWLESAADLLAEPDPGPTPYLIDRLLVDRAVAVIQGAPKVGKTWDVLEFATAIVTGRPALDTFEIPDPGPVMVVLEESGRPALHRRLDALNRGRALEPDALADLHFAANRRVRLDDPEWRQALIDAARALRPRAVFLDPLARLKGAGIDEDSQQEMAVVLDFMRDLRDAADTAVVFTHHTGHGPKRLRGTSDLEAYWESKVTVTRDADGICELASEHREAEAGPTTSYRLAWHEPSRTVRLDPVDPPPRLRSLGDELHDHIAAHPGQTTDEIREAIGRRRVDIAKALENGPFARKPSEGTDGTGRRTRREGWHPAPQTESPPVPASRTDRDAPQTTPSELSRPTGEPPFRGAPGTDQRATEEPGR